MFCDSVTHSVVRFPIASRVGCGEQAPARRSSRALERRGSCTHSIRERVVFAEREVRGGRIPPGLALLPELRLHTLLPRHVERPSRATAQTTVRRAPSHALHAAPRPHPLPQPSPAQPLLPHRSVQQPHAHRPCSLPICTQLASSSPLVSSRGWPAASTRARRPSPPAARECLSGATVAGLRMLRRAQGRCGHSSQCHSLLIRVKCTCTCTMHSIRIGRL